MRGLHKRRRVLVPFWGGDLDPAVLQSAVRLARAEQATLVAAYLEVVPLRYAEDDAPVEADDEAVARLEVVTRTAGEHGVRTDTRLAHGRTLTHALSQLWQAERFDLVFVPAATTAGAFTPKELTWILTHSPAETLILRPENAA